MKTPSGRERSLSGSRYELLLKIASGGMATVYVGQLSGAEGFRRFVAIKRAHGHLVEDATFRGLLVSEARLASRIHHANVVSVLDVEELDGELLLIMDYVEGGALSELLTASADADRPLPARIAVRVVLDVCAGLQAAHELTDDDDQPLSIVHRDVSPQNVLIGTDGISRIADFGIAKGARSMTTTTTGALKGKLAYMAPEYVEGHPVDARSDVFALGVVLWEAIANRRLFRADNQAETVRRVVSYVAPPLSSVAPWVGAALDATVAQALEKSPGARFQSARVFGEALEAAARRQDLVATNAQVGSYLQELVGEALTRRRMLIKERIAETSDRSVTVRRDVAPSARGTVPEPPSSPLASLLKTMPLPVPSPLGRESGGTPSSAPIVAITAETSTMGRSGVSSRILLSAGDTARWTRRRRASALWVVAMGVGAVAAMTTFGAPVWRSLRLRTEAPVVAPTEVAVSAAPRTATSAAAEEASPPPEEAPPTPSLSAPGRATPSAATKGSAPIVPRRSSRPTAEPAASPPTVAPTPLVVPTVLPNPY